VQRPVHAPSHTPLHVPRHLPPETMLAVPHIPRHSPEHDPSQRPSHVPSHMAGATGEPMHAPEQRDGQMPLVCAASHRATTPFSSQFESVAHAFSQRAMNGSSTLHCAGENAKVSRPAAWSVLVSSRWSLRTARLHHA
jgi:hypothetical protein